MKFISWNINGLRAVLNKGFMDYFNKMDADIFCLQEIKLQEGQIDLDLPGYYQYYNYAVKKGYSGTALFSKEKPIQVTYGINMEEHDQEGRVITAEYEAYYFVTCYTPNSKSNLERLVYRQVWEDDFKAYLDGLKSIKPVILCGDLNVAHNEIDIKNPSTNKKSPGFTNEEREKMTALLKDGYVDTYRYLYPEQEGAYSWWSYMGKARANNTGWRIDYFIVSEDLKDKIQEAEIHSDVLGSDHCPVVLYLK